MKKIFAFIMIALTMSQAGCTTGGNLGEKDDLWYDHRLNVLGIITISAIYYCSANKSSDGKSKPECSKAVLKDDESRAVLFRKYRHTYKVDETPEDNFK